MKPNMRMIESGLAWFQDDRHLRARLLLSLSLHLFFSFLFSFSLGEPVFGFFSIRTIEKRPRKRKCLKEHDHDDNGAENDDEEKYMNKRVQVKKRKQKKQKMTTAVNYKNSSAVRARLERRLADSACDHRNQETGGRCVSEWWTAAKFDTQIQRADGAKCEVGFAIGE